MIHESLTLQKTNRRIETEHRHHSRSELFMLRMTCKILFIPFFIASAGPAFSAAPESRSGLDQIVRQALDNNEDLKAAEARWRMYERKIVPAGALDDPMLSLGLVNYPVDSFEDDVTPMTGKDIKISQKFPFPGKLSAKSEMAEQQALWYKGAYEDARLQLERRTKDAYFRLFYVEKAIEITEKNIELLGEFTSLTETRYEVGKGLQQDVLKAQVERSRLMEKLFSFRQQRQSALADL
ncbi:MAG TPA: TolC family protein, partial [Desulfuromonadales bacterium]|nr:TolC family protein [Desulfuromonadales bacterium]